MPDSRALESREFVRIWRLTYLTATGRPIACTINYGLAGQVALERALQAVREAAS